VEYPIPIQVVPFVVEYAKVLFNTNCEDVLFQIDVCIVFPKPVHIVPL